MASEGGSQDSKVATGTGHSRQLSECPDFNGKGHSRGLNGGKSTPRRATFLGGAYLSIKPPLKAHDPIHPQVKPATSQGNCQCKLQLKPQLELEAATCIFELASELARALQVPLQVVLRYFQGAAPGIMMPLAGSGAEGPGAPRSEMLNSARHRDGGRCPCHSGGPAGPVATFKLY